MSKYAGVPTVVSRLVLSLVCCAATSYAQMATAHISGRVLHQNGSPVANALVTVWPMWPSGEILPGPRHTDMQGVYSLTYPAEGSVRVSSSKVSEGYPDAIEALYGRTRSRSVRLLNLKAKPTFSGIDLIFGEPRPRMLCMIRDARTGRAIADAWIRIRLVEDANIWTSHTADGGMFTFPLPRRAVRITIGAPGYAEWHYHDDRSGADVLAAAPGGTRVDVPVLLSPVGPKEQNEPRRVAHGTFTGNLAQTLLWVANTYQVSVVGELAQPFPARLVIAARNEDLQGAMAQVEWQRGQYRSDMRDGVLLVGAPRLLISSNNPMNVRLGQFTVPSSLSEFAATFTNAVGAAARGHTGMGIATSGLGPPSEFSSSLQRRTLRQMSARDILMDVARQARPLVSVFVAPSDHPSRRFLRVSPFEEWAVASGPGLRHYRMALRSTSEMEKRLPNVGKGRQAGGGPD